MTGDVFNTPVYVPYGDIQYLGDNASFELIWINAGTLASGTLDLNLIGTNTSGLGYVFPGGFTVALREPRWQCGAERFSLHYARRRTFADNGSSQLCRRRHRAAVGELLHGRGCITIGGAPPADDMTFTNNANQSPSITVRVRRTPGQCNR